MSALQNRIRELIDQHGSLRAAARVLMTDAGYLSRLGSGEKDNPDDTLLRRMGLRRIVTFEPMNGADNEVQQPNKTDLAAPAVLPLLPIAQAYARLLQHAGTDDKLATDLERLRHSHWTHWTAEENHVVATAVRVLRELNNWRLSNQPPKGTT